MPPKPKEPGTGYLTTHDEWPKVKESLDKGKPVILCLMRESSDGDPTKHHQVLAIGYRMNTPYHLAIQLYDPNHPRTTQELRLELENAKHELHAVHSNGKKFRGFFINS